MFVACLKAYTGLLNPIVHFEQNIYPVGDPGMTNFNSR